MGVANDDTVDRGGEMPGGQASLNALSGQSAPHVSWANAKKRWSKTANVKLFNKDLGKTLDALRVLIKKAAESGDDRDAAKAHDKATKAHDIAAGYKRLCKQKEAQAAGEEKRAWGSLAHALDQANGGINNWLAIIYGDRTPNHQVPSLPQG